VSWGELVAGTPDAVRAALPMVPWRLDRLWRLRLPVRRLPVEQFGWLLELPLWQRDGRRFQVTPRQVLDAPDRFGDHLRRVLAADLRFPVHVVGHRGRLVILDGYHRLAKRRSRVGGRSTRWCCRMPTWAVCASIRAGSGGLLPRDLEVRAARGAVAEPGDDRDPARTSRVGGPVQVHRLYRRGPVPLAAEAAGEVSEATVGAGFRHREPVGGHQIAVHQGDAARRGRLEQQVPAGPAAEPGGPHPAPVRRVPQGRWGAVEGADRGATGAVREAYAGAPMTRDVAGA
jgi:hypothetical protein